MATTQSTPRRGTRLGEFLPPAVVAILLAVGLLAIPVLLTRLLPGRRPSPPQWTAFLVVLAGLLVILGAVALHRYRGLSTRRTLYGVIVGLAVLVPATWGLVQFSPLSVPPVQDSPGFRPYYHLIDFAVGSCLIVGSLIVGRFEYPHTPEYAALGVVFGLWIAYPALLPGAAGAYSLIGYLLVLAAPVVVGYTLWANAGGLLSWTFESRVARWFGATVTSAIALFFVFSTGLVGTIPDNGSGLQWQHARVAFDTFQGPLVMWPAIEFWFPHVPIYGGFNVGYVITIGTMSVLVGLTAAVVARQWQTGLTGGSDAVSGAAALAGPNACCCCGPVFGQVAVAVLGPSLAAPLYWVFVDVNSPLGLIFLTGSVLLLVRGLVRAANG